MANRRNDWTNEKLFTRLLNIKSDRGYWDAIRVLRSRPTQEVFDFAMKLTFSEETKARKIGINVLDQLGHCFGPFSRPFYEQRINRFFELLTSEHNPEIIYYVLIAIGHNNDQLSKMQIDKICSFSTSAEKEVRYSTAHALLAVDNVNAINTLIKLTGDAVDYIRDWATFGIGTQCHRNNKRIREALWNRINDKHREAKYEAIVGLAIRKDPRIIEVIACELQTKEYDSLLFDAIIAINDKQFLPVLELHLNESSADDTINPDWIRSLIECIEELKKL